MTLRSRWSLMAALPVALAFAGCNGKNALSAKSLDSGTTVPGNPNPDGTASLSLDSPGLLTPRPDASVFDTGDRRTDTTPPVPVEAGVSDVPMGPALLVVNPPSVDLGGLDVGGTSAPVTVTVTNRGSVTSGPLTVTVSGAGITATGCSGMTLASQNACTITVTAKTVVAGPITGTVEVGDSPSNTKKIAVSSVSTGGLARFTLTPSPLDLGAVLAGQTVTGTVVMTNTATTGLTGIIFNVSGVGFRPSSAGTCTDALGVGESCQIVVSFTAGTTSGISKAAVTVSQGGVTRTVAVTATVQLPAKLVMTPPSANLMTAPGTPSSPATFYVTNAGDTASEIPKVTITGLNKDDFSFTSDCDRRALPGGATASCSIAVVYTPKVATPTSNAQATLTVADPGPGGSSASASLVGTAVASGVSCAAVEGCGGDVVGTWEVKSSCLQTTGSADIAYMGLTCVPNVATITGSASVSGTLVLGADKKCMDKTVTTGSDVWALDRSCLVLSGTRVNCEAIGTVFKAGLSSYGYEAFSCGDASSGGCTCQGKINQPGGMGLLYNDLNPFGKGTYKTSGNTLTLDDSISYSYCVKGSEMILTPIPAGSTPYTGTVVLQKSGN